MDPAAKRIGAVNCIRIEADGTTTGYNTDYLGFQADLLDYLRESNWTQQAFGLPTNDDLLEVFLEETSALVLGTGGASLAVHEALQELGVTTQAVSRIAGKDRITYAELSPPPDRRSPLHHQYHTPRHGTPKRRPSRTLPLQCPIPRSLLLRPSSTTLPKHASSANQPPLAQGPGMGFGCCIGRRRRGGGFGKREFNAILRFQIPA